MGADDALTPMLVRGLGAVANVALNAVFVFGLDMGVVGAGLGTVIATLFVTVGFGWGSLAGRLPGAGAFPVTVSPGGPYDDAADMRELLAVSLPLIGRRLAQILVVFPLLAIAATFGPVVVAAFEVGRQIRALINAPNWGLSLAASSLVGQSLGAGDRTEARAYGRDVLRFAVVVFVLVTAVVLLLARPIADVFVDGAETLDRTVPFVRVAAASAVAFGIDGAATGVLRGSGHTRWPFYGKLVGLHGAALPLAYLAVASPLGVVDPLGITGLYAALFAETLVPAAVTYYRFHSGAWLPRDRRRPGRDRLRRASRWQPAPESCPVEGFVAVLPPRADGIISVPRPRHGGFNMASGTVAFFHDRKGYGFIETDDADEDVFFHMEDVGGPDLEEGQEVEFDIEQADKGPRAVNLQRV